MVYKISFHTANVEHIWNILFIMGTVAYFFRLDDLVTGFEIVFLGLF